jgi:hypothetical protein
MVLNINQLSTTEMKTDTPSDHYIAYLHGYNLTIAGETYNLAKYAAYGAQRSQR